MPAELRAAAGIIGAIASAEETFLGWWDERCDRDQNSVPIPLGVALSLTAIDHLDVAEIEGVTIQRGPATSGGFRVLPNTSHAARPWAENLPDALPSIGFYKACGRVVAARMRRTWGDVP